MSIAELKLAKASQEAILVSLPWPLNPMKNNMAWEVLKGFKGRKGGRHWKALVWQLVLLRHDQQCRTLRVQHSSTMAMLHQCIYKQSAILKSFEKDKLASLQWQLPTALESEFWLHLLEPIGHVYFSRCTSVFSIWFLWDSTQRKKQSWCVFNP